MQNKRFSYLDCVWYFEHLKTTYPVGTIVTYRHIGNGHNAHTWGYDRHRVGKIKEWLKCENPNYLYKVKLVDTENNNLLTIHPDLIDYVDS